MALTAAHLLLCHKHCDSFLPASHSACYRRDEDERSGLAPVCLRAALSAAGLSGDPGPHGGLGSVSEAAGASELGSDRSGAVFAGGPGRVPSLSGLLVGR